MARPKLNEAQQAHALATISARYLRGDRQVDIGADLGISQPQVSYYLRKLMSEWRARAGLAMDEAQAVELARINQLEQTYWAEWERSRAPQRRTIRVKEQRDTPQGPVSVDRTLRSSAQRLGARTFLQGVEWCIAQRCKLLGLESIAADPEEARPHDPPSAIDAAAVAAAEAVLLDAYRAQRAGLVSELPADGHPPHAGGDPA
jgi:hypothetical protein